MKEQENPYLNARKKHNEYEGGSSPPAIYGRRSASSTYSSV